MAHSVEARTPFLDHHLTEYVNRLPPSVKLRYGAESDNGVLGPTWTESSIALQSLTEKWILRQAVRPYITDELYQRKKHPFLAPTRWTMDGPLHRMFKTLLTPQAVEQLGFVNYATIQEAMDIAWGEKADAKAFRLLVPTSAMAGVKGNARCEGIRPAERPDEEDSGAKVEIIGDHTIKSECDDREEKLRRRPGKIDI
ncbi:MAG: hypothetical protein Q9184_003954 [Pyrenodesmia sp. 2 TL-2023]